MQQPNIVDQYKQTVEEIEELANFALSMRDTTSMIDVLERITAMCKQTQNDCVEKLGS